MLNCHMKKCKFILITIMFFCVLTILYVSYYWEQMHMFRLSFAQLIDSSMQKTKPSSSDYCLPSSIDDYHFNIPEELTNDSYRIFYNYTNPYNYSMHINISTARIINPHPYKFIINHPNLCNINVKNLSLVVIVITAVKHFEQRQAIRETWGGYARTLGANLLFLLGHPFNEDLQKEILEEDRKFHDILQEDFYDTYLNLSLKTVSMLKWVAKYCRKVKLVLKIDDDNFLNVDLLMKFVQNQTGVKSMYGLLAHLWMPARDPKSKWHMPEWEYPMFFYPDFLAGPAYMFTGDVANILYQASCKIPPLRLEDVYVSGVLAEVTGVKRFSLRGVNNLHQKIRPCAYKTMINSHEHSPLDLYKTWSLIHKKYFICIF